MSSIFSFGEKLPEYDMKVLNEREVRASAGILFLFAMIAFLNSWLIGDFSITKIFVVLFLVDFSIRVLINPKFSPTLIVGRFFVRNQTVEYVGAPQKRVAWLIGLVLAVVMFYLIVLNNLVGPFNLLVCLICLTLLFFEAAFGICLGCKLYNLFNKEKAQLCPGNACEIKDKQPIQKIKAVQFGLVALFLGLVFAVANSPLIKIQHGNVFADSSDTKNATKDCVAPDWAINMGHEEKWKMHNGCKDDPVKKPVPVEKADTKAPVAAIQNAAQTQAVTETAEVNEDCVVPDWAVKIGHKDKWKLHNGCKGTDVKKPEEVAALSAPVQTEVQSPFMAPVRPSTPVASTTTAPPAISETTTEEKKDCVAPDWAIKMGHEEMWKTHNGCNSEPQETETMPSAPVPTHQVETVVKASIPTTEQPSPETSNECVVPDWAVKMGHQEMWKQHNCQ